MLESQEPRGNFKKGRCFRYCNRTQKKKNHLNTDSLFRNPFQKGQSLYGIKLNHMKQNLILLMGDIHGPSRLKSEPQTQVIELKAG